jgi:assimilatory nitrate reductase catalytic subunit
VDALVEGNTDPVSGQPELKFTPVAVTPYPAVWHGFAVSEQMPLRDGLDYWALARAKGGFRLELAGLSPVEDWASFAHALLSLHEGADILAYHDAGAGQYRFAAFKGERLTGALFIARDLLSISRSWACEQLGRTITEPRDRLRLLAGRAAAASEERGAIVCSCFEVGAKQIADALAAGRCRTVDQIGRELRAGTNCGSCRSEINQIIQSWNASKAG